MVVSQELGRQQVEIGGRTVELLVPLERYLSAGMHIGTHICTAYMKKFVYRVRPDGLYILDIRRTDERLRVAAKFLARFDPSKIVVVSVRQYGQRPVQKFCTYLGCKALTGRILPGTFTNPSLEWYMEPDVVIISDPRADSQAVDEAARMGVPTVALADTDNRIENIDLVIPVNNKGRRSLALTYWILAREILREQGKLQPDQDLPEPPEAFEFKVRRR
ncbi:MAG TPA: 30S ribosomal protein S2 [Pyrodictium delaneyi]|uniref:Small ribosomal subunit protein uS2 n=1 Tax=Pyrodictium delaneyi TaxID=1273541 RepID=A0A833EB00_9CREN|nr:30S ribosomal protein S2 [Pyrodictium delaneyi]